MIATRTHRQRSTGIAGRIRHGIAVLTAAAARTWVASRTAARREAARRAIIRGQLGPTLDRERAARPERYI